MENELIIIAISSLAMCKASRKADDNELISMRVYK